MFLETERLALREFTEDDVDALVTLDADPAVMRFLNGGKPTSRLVIQRDVLPRILAAYARGLPERWVALDKATHAFLGWFELLRAAEGEFELGYRLASRAWGNGYATEGSRALVDKAFTEYGAHRVFAETMAANKASRRVMEKAGLTYVRTFHLKWDDPIEGTEHGEVEYGLQRADWARAGAYSEDGRDRTT